MVHVAAVTLRVFHKQWHGTHRIDAMSRRAVIPSANNALKGQGAAG